MELSKAKLDELTAEYKTPGDVEKLFSQMLQHMINRSLEAEMQAHVGHAPHGRSSGNARNGKSRKRVQSAVGDLQIETPRDREGSFEPQLVKKRQVRLAGMEEKILALYARGMTTRDIETALVDLYGVEISHTLIAQVTDAVHAVFPKTLMQLCIVHLVRASLRYVTAGDSKAVVVALKRIYQSATAEEEAVELEALEAQWGDKYRAVVRLWRGNWDTIIPFFQFLPEIRKVVYTTNAIESLNMVMRKYTRNRRIFPNDDAALKAMYLAVREASKNWKSIHHWKPALQSFQVMFGEDRVPMAAL